MKKIFLILIDIPTAAKANLDIDEDCHLTIMHYLSQYLRNIDI